MLRTKNILFYYCDGYNGDRVLFFGKISKYCTNFVNRSMPEKWDLRLLTERQLTEQTVDRR